MKLLSRIPQQLQSYLEASSSSSCGASSSSFLVLFIDRESASSFSPLLVGCGSARFRVAVLRFLLRLLYSEEIDFLVEKISVF